MTLKPYFADVVAGSPSQVVKDYELVDAATDGETVHLQRLLKSGADPRTHENTPLQVAAANGHVEAVRLLLQYGASRDDRDALLEAARGGYADIVEELVKNGVDSATLDEALKFASEGNAQAPGVFLVREDTPEGGHKRTIEILKCCRYKSMTA